VVGALTHIRDGRLANVRLHMGDALAVLERLPDASLSFVYLLHPDPWPKARHAKRRMVNDGPLDLIAAKLKPGGEFRLGTDDPVYCRWSMMVMSRRRDFEWLAERAADFLVRPGGWPETRYEAKARRHGREVWYFRYRRAGGVTAPA
jgi:tRNA (guanine-N7-)-methyltransferase